MNRRAFLTTLAAALTLDPERALWVPGKRLISIAAPAPDPLWLQVSFPRYFQTRESWAVDLDRATVLLVQEWQRREQRAGRTFAPVAPPLPTDPGIYSRVERIGRFAIRRIDANDPIRDRMITRLDIANTEGISENRGAALFLR